MLGGQVCRHVRRRFREWAGWHRSLPDHARVPVHASCVEAIHEGVFLDGLGVRLPGRHLTARDQLCEGVVQEDHPGLRAHLHDAHDLVCLALTDQGADRAVDGQDLERRHPASLLPLAEGLRHDALE